MENKSSLKLKKLLKIIWPIIIAILILLGVPLLIIKIQASQTNMSVRQVLHRIYIHARYDDFIQDDLGIEILPKGDQINFLTSREIGKKFTEHPRISHLQIADLDQDKINDVLFCDCVSHTVNWIRQSPLGTFNETVLASGLIAPAHIQVVDIDQDNDLDVVVAVLGMLFPNNDPVGSVVILINDGKQQFTKLTILKGVARVSDVRAGDLDGDGDLDLAVAQFGYDDGETRWMENLGGLKFKSHMLQSLSGPINAEIVDIDNDKDNDIIVLVSQEWEEIYLFENDGKGKFTTKLIYGSQNDDFGSSGISLSDLDQDGDIDILYANGDAFDYIPPRPRPWHGVQWLENQGNHKFKFHRIGNLGGAYNARANDIDADGDLDLFLVSAFNSWDNPASQSFVWFENVGEMRYQRHDIANSPTHQLPLELGDMNGDGKVDMVSGGMHIYPPHDREGRITLWINNGNIK